ncbi:MAG TPA: hypothetical protein VMT03_04735 [Polyangia bacterium]|nr:hypothetical protein [Polyangia bacterium]
MKTLATRKLERLLSIALPLAVFVAVGALRVGSARASAAADQEAEALIHQGVQLRSQDQTARALLLFQKAYQLSPTPRPAAQLGLCEMELGHYVEAERHLSEALASPDHPWIAKNRTVLDTQLQTARANIGELVVSVSPASADVLLNGTLLEEAQVGTPIRLSKGSVDVDVRAAGYVRRHETITISGGQREQRTFTLVPVASRSAVAAVAPPPAVPPPPMAPVQAAVPIAPVEIEPAPPQPAGGRMSSKRLAAWITAGAAVGALAFGTSEAFNAASRRDAFNNHTITYGGVVVQDCGTNNLSGACKPLKDSYDQAITLTVVGFAAAGALAAASSVLFLLSSPDHGETPEGAGARAFACAPDVVNRGLGCALRF